jgi:deazaflavin-dependent oxidoreductase (nitroreductase family)
MRASRWEEAAMSDARPYIRPGFVLARLVNPVARHLRPVTTLTVAGRKSGQPRIVPMGAPFEYRGRRYLVSGRGNTHWVRNLRAAGGGQLRSHGRTETIRTVELSGPERDEIVRAYRDHLGHSVDEYFTTIPDPADHPAFRIDPA